MRKILQKDVRKWRKIALKYAQDCAKINYPYYKYQRNQGDFDRLVAQSFTGKLAEIGVYLILRDFSDYIKNKGIELHAPDFNVYPREKKSWARDLGDFSVKSASTFGECPSWMFQYKDKNGLSGNDLILTDPVGYVVLTEVRFFDLDIIVKVPYVIEAKKVMAQKYLQLPHKENLKNIKRCIQKDDLVLDFGNSFYDFSCSVETI